MGEGFTFDQQSINRIGESVRFTENLAGIPHAEKRRYNDDGDDPFIYPFKGEDDTSYEPPVETPNTRRVKIKSGRFFRRNINEHYLVSGIPTQARTDDPNTEGWCISKDIILDGQEQWWYARIWNVYEDYYIGPTLDKWTMSRLILINRWDGEITTDLVYNYRPLFHVKNEGGSLVFNQYRTAGDIYESVEMTDGYSRDKFPITGDVLWVKSHDLQEEETPYGAGSIGTIQDYKVFKRLCIDDDVIIPGVATPPAKVMAYYRRDGYGMMKDYARIDGDSWEDLASGRSLETVILNPDSNYWTHQLYKFWKPPFEEDQDLTTPEWAGTEPEKALLFRHDVPGVVPTLKYMNASTLNVASADEAGHAINADYVANLDCQDVLDCLVDFEHTLLSFSNSAPGKALSNQDHDWDYWIRGGGVDECFGSAIGYGTVRGEATNNPLRIDLFGARLQYGGAGTEALRVDWQEMFLQCGIAGTEVTAVDWEEGIVRDKNNAKTIDWLVRGLYTPIGDRVMDWELSQLKGLWKVDHTSFEPLADDTTDLGIATKRWKEARVKDLYVAEIYADPSTGSIAIRNSLIAPFAGCNLGGTGTYQFDNLYLRTGGGVFVNDNQLVTDQQSAVADAAGGSVVDAEARTAINDLLSRLRTHGLIAT